MPRKGSGLFAPLVPALVLVPMCGILTFFLISSWQEQDARAALNARLEDSAFAMARELGDSLERQKLATEQLSQSPLAWIWVKFQGERLTPSNRAHADTALNEIENYARLLPFAQILLGSENTRTLYKGGAPVKRLRENDPEDAWYFASLKAEGVPITGDARGIRTSARVMDEGRVWGAVAMLSDLSALAANVFSATSLRTGMRAALANGAGEVLRVGGEGASKAGTLFDMYPAAAHQTLSSALEALAGSDKPVVFTVGTGADVVLTVGIRSSVPGWDLFVSSALESTVSRSRLLLIAGVPAATLVLLLLAFILTAGRRLRSAAALLERHERNRIEARDAFSRIEASARGAHAAAAQLQALAGRLAEDAAAAAASTVETDALFARAEERDAELRAGIAGRVSLLAELTAAVGEAIDRSRSTEAAARIVGASATQAEEELSRVITSSASAAHALDKASKAVDAIVEAAGRMRMLSLNAALEAARGVAQGQGHARITDDVRSLADETAARARALAASLTEASASLEGASRAAQEAGRAVHEASADAARASGGGWEKMVELLSHVQNANASAGRVSEHAAASDRGRSALAGISRVVGRIGSLSVEIVERASRAGADASDVARSVAAGADIAGESAEMKKREGKNS
jgi:methyl-accepting chemotaxis protein